MVLCQMLLIFGLNWLPMEPSKFHDSMQHDRAAVNYVTKR